MNDLIARLRQRALLPEFRICGEAAAALDAAHAERDEANRRYHEICNVWLKAQKTTRSKRPPASKKDPIAPDSRKAANRDHPDDSAFS